MLKYRFIPSNQRYKEENLIYSCSHVGSGSDKNKKPLYPTQYLNEFAFKRQEGQMNLTITSYSNCVQRQLFFNCFAIILKTVPQSCFHSCMEILSPFKLWLQSYNWIYMYRLLDICLCCSLTNYSYIIYLMIESCTSKDHRDTVGPLWLISPFPCGVVPQVYTGWKSHQTIWKLPPNLK